MDSLNQLFSRRKSMEGGNAPISTKELEAKPVYKHCRSASVSEISAGCQVDEKRSQQEIKWLDLLRLRDKLRKVSPSFWSVRNYFNAQLLKSNSSYSEENFPKIWRRKKSYTAEWKKQPEECRRLEEDKSDPDNRWREWGPYLSERQWGTVREDYSHDGTW